MKPKPQKTINNENQVSQVSFGMLDIDPVLWDWCAHKHLGYVQQHDGNHGTNSLPQLQSELSGSFFVEMHHYSCWPGIHRKNFLKKCSSSWAQYFTELGSNSVVHGRSESERGRSESERFALDPDV